MTLEMLLKWWNLMYLVPLGLALVYLVVYSISGVTFGEADADAQADADGDGDADGDADHDHDAAADHHLDHHVDHEAVNAVTGGLSLFGILSLIGVGKVPLSVVLMVLLLLWGVIGMAANQLLFPALGAGWLVALVSLPLAFFGSTAGTGLVARGFARFMPPVESYALRRKDMINRAGEAVYGIDEKFGIVAVRDAAGDLFQHPARTGVGAKPIAKGARVVLFEYDEDLGVYLVAPFEEVKPPPTPPLADLADAPPRLVPEGREARKEQTM